MRDFPDAGDEGRGGPGGDPSRDGAAGSPPAGLCASCRHVRRIRSRTRSTFYFCERSRSDDRFPRYPRIPVLRCPGYEEDAATATRAEEGPADGSPVGGAREAGEG